MQSMLGLKDDTHAAHGASSTCPSHARLTARRHASSAALAAVILAASRRFAVSLLSCAGLVACVDAAPSAAPPASDRATPAASASTVAPEASPGSPWLVNVSGTGREAPRPHPCPPRVPEALNPPAGVTIELAWPASGVQIYACTQAKAGEGPSWTLEGPHALLTSGKSVAAIHFAGPSWQALDGSSVRGARLNSAEAPDASGVPWLLMSATPSGAGTFAHTTHIQRLETSGGKPPASGCDAAHAGAKVLVPYQASYYFYRQASGGEAVHQCRSAGPARP